MPRLPIADQIATAPSTGPTTLIDSSKATDRAFGADQSGNEAMGAAIAGLGDAITEAAYKQQVEDNANEARRLDNEYAREVETILNGDSETGEVGFYNLQTRDALEQADAYRQRMRETREKYLGSTGNAEQKKLLTRSLQERERSYIVGFNRHHGTERKKDMISNSEARLGNSIEEAGMVAYDETIIEEAIIPRIRGEARALAIAKGDNSPEAIQKEVNAGMTLMVQSVVARQEADGNIQNALDTLEKYKGHIEPTAHAKMLNSLQNEADDQTVDAVLNWATNFSANPSIQLELIRRSLEGDQEVAAIRRWVTLNNAARQQAKDEEDEAGKRRVQWASETLEKWIKKEGGSAADLRDKVWPKVEALPAGLKKNEMMDAYKQMYAMKSRQEQDNYRKIQQDKKKTKAEQTEAAENMMRKYHAKILASDDPAGVFASIKKGERVTMTPQRVETLRQLTNRLSAGHQQSPTEGNIGHFNAIMKMPYHQLVNYDVTLEIPNLTNEQFKTFEKKYQEMQAKRPEIEKAIFNAEGRLTSLLGELGLGGKLTTETNKAKANTIRTLWEEMVVEATVANGFEPLKDSQLQEIKGQMKKERKWLDPDEFWGRWLTDYDTYYDILADMDPDTKEGLIAKFQEEHGYYPSELDIARQAVKMNNGKK